MNIIKNLFSLNFILLSPSIISFFLNKKLPFSWQPNRHSFHFRLQALRPCLSTGLPIELFFYYYPLPLYYITFSNIFYIVAIFFTYNNPRTVGQTAGDYKGGTNNRKS